MVLPSFRNFIFTCDTTNGSSQQHLGIIRLVDMFLEWHHILVEQLLSMLISSKGVFSKNFLLHLYMYSFMVQ